MKELHLALIGGPQYDGLLELLPAFEQQKGYRLHVDVRLPHVELNERMAKDLGTENGHYDMISTHTKYCPSQAEHLRSLDELVSTEDLSDFVPRVLELCRFANGTDQTHEELIQLPRNLDVRLLF
jgi:multiple sugar transport system substrate-binding protein